MTDDLTMDVRPATPEDLTALASFDEWNAVSPSCIIAGECFVADIDGAPVAFGILDRSFFKRRFVAMLYVHPEHRRRGLGRALLRHFESITDDPTLWISTNVENLTMQRLLHAEGYTLSGVVNNLAPLPELVFFKALRNEEEP